ncbi:hypothetical protein [Streptomyces sp. NPDC001781]
MRGPETDRLLADVQRAVVAARAGGVTVEACLFDAAVAAVDESAGGWPSAEARRAAVTASRVMEPSDAMADPEPRSRPPVLARLLWALANRVAARGAAS